MFPVQDPTAAERARERWSAQALGDEGGRRLGRAVSADDPADGPGADGADGSDADPEAVARAICLRLLTAAPRTRAQLATAMRRKGLPEDVSARVLDRFEELHLINDTAYAEAFIENRKNRGLARRALADQLRQRGVDAAVADEALGEVDPEAEHASALAFAAERFRRFSPLPAQVAVRRLYGMLVRKGYSTAVSSRVIREVVNGGR
ncbi:MAG TPA: regulatory protein RecX [Mycobacteriales bacterium]|nr:regulatory protein RecX [Mycobacteriales bacterium]